MSEPPVALVGTTASGKSAVAMALAARRPGTELVCIDSMTVYRGMDIATAKPSPADRAAVPHHLVDLVDPSDEFTVAEFQAAAKAALRGIAERGHRALLVGGTGLYLRAVVDDLEFPSRYPDLAAALEAEADGPDGLAQLHARLGALDPLAASRTTATNRRRIVRALEVTLGSGRPFSSFGPGLTAYPPTDVALVGLPFDAAVVGQRIDERFRRWVDEGLVDEVSRLARRPEGLSRTARQALGYKELLAHVLDGAPLAACVDAAIQRTRTFARRQMAWFRRDPRIRWATSADDAVELLGALLDTPHTRATRTSPGHTGPGDGVRAPAVRARSDGRETVPMVHAAPPRTDGASTEATVRQPRALSKHEAAGNDFLVLVDPEPTWTPSPAFVRSVCDRRRGVGADGLLIARRASAAAGVAAGAELEMVLFNADGSRAEMSGNGIRCLVQAAVLAGTVAPGTVRVRTDAGIRCVEYVAADAHASASVDMGTVDIGAALPSPLAGARAHRANVGNPHVVVVVGAGEQRDGAGEQRDGAGEQRDGAAAPTDQRGDLDLARVAADVTATLGEPVNVEVVWHTAVDTLALRVFERGVGETAACGTGSCAAAAVARELGMVGDVVTVENPGGPLIVRLGPVPGDPVFLSGPVHHVADVVLAPASLLATASA